MTRTVVIRHEASAQVNVNDEIGLEPYSSYTLAEHLEDLESDGLKVIGTAPGGVVYVFSDGSTQILVQQRKRIAVDSLDEETQWQILSTVAARAPVDYARRDLLSA